MSSLPPQPAMPPLGNEFTLTASTATQIGHESTGSPPTLPVGCNKVWIQNPAVTDAGATQAAALAVLVGWANPGLSNVAANVTYPVTLMPGDPPFAVVCKHIDDVWVKPAGAVTPLVKYWAERSYFLQY